MEKHDQNAQQFDQFEQVINRDNLLEELQFEFGHDVVYLANCARYLNETQQFKRVNIWVHFHSQQTWKTTNSVKDK